MITSHGLRRGPCIALLMTVCIVHLLRAELPPAAMSSLELGGTGRFSIRHVPWLTLLPPCTSIVTTAGVRVETGAGGGTQAPFKFLSVADAGGRLVYTTVPRREGEVHNFVTHLESWSATCRLACTGEVQIVAEPGTPRASFQCDVTVADPEEGVSIARTLYPSVPVGSTGHVRGSITLVTGTWNRATFEGDFSYQVQAIVRFPCPAMQSGDFVWKGRILYDGRLRGARHMSVPTCGQKGSNLSVQVHDDGRFEINLPGGQAHIADCFIDVDGDGRRGEWEPFTHPGQGLVFPTATVVSADVRLEDADTALAGVPDWMNPYLVGQLLGRGWVTPYDVRAQAGTNIQEHARALDLANAALASGAAGEPMFFGFDQAEHFAVEQNGSVRIRLVARPASRKPVSGKVVAVGGNLRHGLDHTFSATPFMLPAGSNAVEVEVGLLRDEVREPSRGLVLEIRDSQGYEIPPLRPRCMLHVRDASVDGDLDGLPDSWELRHFGRLKPGALDDPDGDGWNNLLEWARGANPNIAFQRNTDRNLTIEIITPEAGLPAMQEDWGKELHLDSKRTVYVGMTAYEYRRDGRLARMAELGPVVRTYNYTWLGAFKRLTLEGALPSILDRSTAFPSIEMPDPARRLTRGISSPLERISVSILPETNLAVTVNDEMANHEGSGLWTALVPFNNLTTDLVAPVVVRAIEIDRERVTEATGTVNISSALYERRRDLFGDPVEIASGDARHKSWRIGAEWMDGR